MPDYIPTTFTVADVTGFQAEFIDYLAKKTDYVLLLDKLNPRTGSPPIGGARLILYRKGAEVAKIAREDAQKEVRVQVADWKAYREQIAGTVAAAPAKPALPPIPTSLLRLLFVASGQTRMVETLLDSFECRAEKLTRLSSWRPRVRPESGLATVMSSPRG